ncbi:MAG: hypothetical protein HY720_17285 [Planctomycetes bacterium]|nr:hypothetical protein [Planctomycetota bacterium]
MSNPRFALLAFVLLFPGLGTASSDELTVQARWRVGVVTAGWDKPYSAREVVVEAGRYVSRELSGIEWEVLEGEVAIPPLAEPGDEALQTSLEANTAADFPLAACDFLVVFAPFEEESRYYGYALASFRPGGDPRARAIWFTAVNLRPEKVVLGGLAREMAKRGLADEGNRLAAALAPLSERLLGDGRVLRHSLVATTVHEFGHFLAPGDPDVKDGLQAPWIKNGDPDDNPDGHALECVMYTPKSARSVLAKATRAFPDGIRFCDACKERLGVRR